jgi:phospholipid/cholesterol/gamma-HCH transport system ATP-binding protein
MKLELVGLEAFTGSHARGAVGRHAEACRHRASDGARPVDPVPRRALVGPRPDNRRVARRDIRRLSKSLGVTFVIVTHDLGSVFVAMDRVILLDRRAKGIIAEGDPRRLRDETTDPRVRAFFRREAEPVAS